MLSKLNILLVDDDVDDHFFFREALKNIEVPTEVTSVYNGSQALNFLLKEGAYSKVTSPIPDLIIVDINMPILDGFGLLRILKSNQAFSGIPVVMLSTSNANEDQVNSKRLGASGFFTKPVLVEQLSKIFESIVLKTVSDKDFFAKKEL